LVIIIEKWWFRGREACFDKKHPRESKTTTKICYLKISLDTTNIKITNATT